MSGFLKTVSNLEQSFFTCLPAIAGREAFAVLEKPGVASVKEGWGRKPRGLATSWYQRGGEGFIPWRVGRVTERGLLLSQSAYFLLQDSLGQTCPAGLGAESQPARHKQGRWVDCVLTACLWLIEGKILCIFWEKFQGGCVDINTIFKYPDSFICLSMFRAAGRHALDFLIILVPSEFRFFFVAITWKLTRWQDKNRLTVSFTWKPFSTL